MKEFHLLIFLAFISSGYLLNLTKEQDLVKIGIIPKLLCNIENTHFVQLIFDSKYSGLTADKTIQMLLLNCPSFLPIQIFGFSTLIQKPRNRCDSKRTVTILILKNQNLTDNRIYLNAVVKKNDEEKDYRKYLVILDETVVSETTGIWIDSILRYFCKQNTINVVIAIGLHFSSIFTFIPFSCYGWKIQEIFLEDCLPNGVFFPKLINLYGTELTVSILQMNMKKGYQSLDTSLGMLLEERLNATFRYRQSAESSSLLTEVLHSKIQFLLTSQSLITEYFSGTVEVTSAFSRNDLCFLVPNAGFEPTIYNLLKIYTLESWLILIGTYFIISELLYWFEVAQSKFEFLRQDFSEAARFEVMKILFQSFFGDSIVKLPKSTLLRSLIITWIFCSFLLTNAYVAKLISFLVLPRKRSEINSIEDLKFSTLKIILPESIYETIANNFDSLHWKWLNDHIIRVPSDQDVEKLTETNKTGNAYVLEKSVAIHIAQKYFSKSTGRSVYHIMDDLLLSLPKVYLLEQGSPFLGRINELILRFHEMGFVKHWLDLIEFENIFFQGNDDTSDALDQIKVVLTVEHLQAAFYILSLGHVTATIVFFIELYYSSYKKKAMKKVFYFDKELARKYGCNVD